MDKRHVEPLAGLPRDPAVASEDDHFAACVEELVGLSTELIPPFDVERLENVVPDLVEAVVGAP